MCISILSTAHPDYPFILLSNRDEFIDRPTLRANWWDPPFSQILGGRDTKRQERGTWLGLTKQGRIAILTNFRESGDTHMDMNKSRGAMPNAFLTVPPESEETDHEFVESLMKVGINDMGGFTMLFGKLRAPRPLLNGHSEETVSNGTNGTKQHAESLPGLAIISNRTRSTGDLKRIATRRGETYAASNSHFGDLSWPKVVHGEQLLKQAIVASVTRGDSQDVFLDHLFDILDQDTMPDRSKNESLEAYCYHMRNSIMIPPAKSKGWDSNLDASEEAVRSGKEGYGTAKHTIVLVNSAGRVTFIERTLYEDGVAVPEDDRDRKIEFDIEGWE